MFFSPSSSVGSIPAMFDVQQPTEANFNVQPNTAMFAGPAMMQPMMMMSPQPSGMIISVLSTSAAWLKVAVQPPPPTITSSVFGANFWLQNFIFW